MDIDFFRKDRNFDIHDVGKGDLKDEISGGGGSIIYFKDALDVNLVQSFYNKAPDSLAIEIDSSIGKFCIACVYRSSNLNDLLNRGGGGKALTMTMTPGNLPHGQWSKKS